MIKKLLNIYDEDLYLSIQVHAKTNRSDANAFINKAMEEKAQRDGVKMITVGAPERKVEDVDFSDEIIDGDFNETTSGDLSGTTSFETIEDDKTF
jgi:hypothetical protein